MEDIDIFLKEDLGDIGDITSDNLFQDEKAKGYILSKQDCYISGIEESEKIFNKLNIESKFYVKDGEFIKKDVIVANLTGEIRNILKAERLVLNFIGRMSGITSETKKIVDQVHRVNPSVDIAATRKTTPGFRKHEKKAVIVGGGIPHRYGLYDEILIKDNHIKKIGSVEKTIEIINEKIKDKKIEIEVENKQDAIAAAKLNVDIIMLDNFPSDKARDATILIKKINPKIIVEISGGITPENINDYALFADRISLGYLTHSISSKDFSMEIK